MHFIQNSLIFCLAWSYSAGQEVPGNTSSVRLGGVLDHAVEYSELPPTPDYQSSAEFDPRGMEHVYFIVNTFLDLILRQDVLPKSLTTQRVSEAVGSGKQEDVITFLTTHWQDILLQYVGLLTAALIGLLAAIIIPLIGFFFCCCRCAGRCGAYPDTHYDKKSDSCKRVVLGILLSFFVIAALFGAVSAFVCNQYSFAGWSQVTTRLDSSLEDTGEFIQHAGDSIETLLVTNFAEMEEDIGQILDDSGPILKKKLADITEAIAIDDLTNIVSGLDEVKRRLNQVLDYTRTLDDKVNQLKDGLSRSQKDLNFALTECKSNTACANFLQEFDLEKDLAMAEDFISIKFNMPEVNNVLRDISLLIESDIEQKVKEGKAEMDNIEGKIENSILDIKPKVKSEIRQMGVQLETQNNEIQSALREIDVAVIQKDVPQLDQHSELYIKYRYYVGLGMASLVLIILGCFIMGLFYGMCGKRPGGLYGDDCCNRGTGANFLASGVYFTFLFSFVLLILTTAHFLIGATLEKNPGQSDLFDQVDAQFIRPRLNDALSEISGGSVEFKTAEVISECHQNLTLYTILKLEKSHNISQLADWRKRYGIGDYIENLKNKIQLEQLKHITLLSPETSKDLKELADSKISDMNFTQFTTLLENEITKIDLKTFITRLKVLKDQVYSFDATRAIAPKLENEALWLGQMNDVVEEMKVTVKNLTVTVAELEEISKFNKSSMREAITSLLSQANRATEMIQTEGPELITTLTDQYVTETVDIIDDYVSRVTEKIQTEVGFCSPLSTSYNATVISVCQEVVEPFNGFWASVGWCYLLYLPCVLLSLSLISLYRKVEPYPGPLVEAQPLQEADKGREKKKRRGHTRNPSGYLPEYTHARPLPGQTSQGRFRDIAPSNWDPQSGGSGGGGGQPPRYTSNPSLGAAGEYERPPPYYYPGPK